MTTLSRLIRAFLSASIFPLAFVASVSLLAPTQTLAQAGCCTARGNVDCDPAGSVDIADLTMMIDNMFISLGTYCCQEAANVDGSVGDTVDIADLTLFIDVLFISLGTLPTCETSGMPFEQRQALFDAIDSAKATLDGLPAETLAVRLSTFLNGRPEIDSAGVMNGVSIWAWFIDGRIILIPNNRFPESGSLHNVDLPDILDSDEIKNAPVPPRRYPNELDPAPRVSQELATSAGNLELPHSIQARVFNTLATPRFTPGVPLIKSLLESHGYVTVPMSGSVASLFSVNGDGVFYIDAHGGSFPSINGNDRLAIWTKTEVTPDNDALYANLLHREELVYMDCPDENPITHANEDRWKYGFTGRFVAQYMYFAPGSIVFINACEGDSVPSLRQGFFTAGASVFCGWTKTVGDPAANKAGEFMFDRLLGANASTLSPKESPPQRPFDVDLVWQQMKTKGYETQASNGSKLRVQHLQNKFGLLNPSIRYMAVVEHFDTLYVTGCFGSDPGPANRRVIVGGTELIVYTWEPEIIMAFIPNTGAGSVGPVTVEVDGRMGPTYSVKRKSNVVNLTTWEGLFTYTMKDTDSLYGKIEINAKLRADIHAFRDYPGETPKNYSVIFPAMESSYGTATVGGAYSYTYVEDDPVNTDTWTWSGSQPLPGLWEQDLTGFLLTGTVHFNTHKLDMRLVAAKYTGLKETLMNDVYGLQHILDIGLGIPFQLYDGFPSLFFLNMSNVWDIQAGSRSYLQDCCAINPGGNLSDEILHLLTWPTIPAAWAPDPTAAQ